MDHIEKGVGLRASLEESSRQFSVRSHTEG
jgi:hypothetical protein